jgi:hypothetical protein
MRSRRLLWLSALVLPGLWAAWLVLPGLRPRPSITQEDYDRIRVGMTLAEVEGVLGGPPGDYAGRPVFVTRSEVESRRWWVGNEAVIMIELGPVDGPDTPRRVRSHACSPVPRESFAARCRRLLPW